MAWAVESWTIATRIPAQEPIAQVTTRRCIELFWRQMETISNGLIAFKMQRRLARGRFFPGAVPRLTPDYSRKCNVRRTGGAATHLKPGHFVEHNFFNDESGSNSTISADERIHIALPFNGTITPPYLDDYCKEYGAVTFQEPSDR